MYKYVTKKNILYVSGAVVLGILGNALWEAIKPASGFMFRIILNVSTLGIENFKNNIYLDIARGLHEAVSLELYSMTMSIFAAFYLSLWYGLILSRRYESEEGDQMRNMNFFRRYKGWLVPLCVIIVLVATSLMVTKERYINKSVSYFNQTITILSPYITDEQILMLKSRFSQIKQKEDFEIILNDLEDIAQQNNVELEEFGIVF